MVTFSSYHVVVLVNVVAMLYPVWTPSLHRFVVFASVLGRSAARVFIHEVLREFNTTSCKEKRNKRKVRACDTHAWR
jgi:hypothetical protein